MGILHYLFEAIPSLWSFQLADLANLTQPWSVDAQLLAREAPDSTLRGFKNATKDIPIPLEDLEREYCKHMQQPYPITEMTFVRSWMLFRLSIIAQGIAARYARRQASSEHAHKYVAIFPLVGRLAISVLEDAGIKVQQSDAKL
jgi:aminoglycoside phosphotransferase (APT) family kinase protein